MERALHGVAADSGCIGDPAAAGGGFAGVGVVDGGEIESHAQFGVAEAGSYGCEAVQSYGELGR
jgi:hypothetical protein